jgi:hypothetical protein
MDADVAMASRPWSINASYPFHRIGEGSGKLFAEDA